MPIPESHNAQALRNRFGLSQGQIATPYTYKNLWWELDGEFFGYGDISPEDVFRIQNHLENGEIFQGWNEHHQSAWQQTKYPMIRIKMGDIEMHGDIVTAAQVDPLLEDGQHNDE
jgi:hypothetical protein